MPQIPFEVYYQEYDKTVHVVGSCDPDTYKSKTLYFEDSVDDISIEVFKAVDQAFDQPGVVRIQICRVTKEKANESSSNNPSSD